MKLTLTGGFEPIPEGVHTFKITAVEYKPDFGKMIINTVTETGKKHIERFSLLDGKGKPNSAAMNAFSFFARTVMDDQDLDEIDDQDLVGHFFRATVEHTVVESNKTPGKMLTFVKLSDTEPAHGFDDEEEYLEEDDDPDDLLASILG